MSATGVSQASQAKPFVHVTSPFGRVWRAAFNDTDSAWTLHFPVHSTLALLLSKQYPFASIFAEGIYPTFICLFSEEKTEPIKACVYKRVARIRAHLSVKVHCTFSFATEQVSNLLTGTDMDGHEPVRKWT